MMVMVVLWPKMKAPQSRVTAPQTVRMTLERTSSHVTVEGNNAKSQEEVELETGLLTSR